MERKDTKEDATKFKEYVFMSCRVCFTKKVYVRGCMYMGWI